MDVQGHSSLGMCGIMRQTQSDLRKASDDTRILASLVPDEIIYRDTDESHFSRFNGVLLFVDVSGFTDLCERYNTLGKGGPSRITQVLNEYIGAMVQEIMSHNGDITKFSGDAFLALWKSNDDISMSDVVHAALDCALAIQRSHGTYITEVGITLKVKIALAGGSVIFVVIGDSNYMVLGKTMFDVKELGNLCNPGEIIISSSIKFFLGLNEYILEIINNTAHAKILSIGPDWTPCSLGNQFELFDIFTVSASKRTEADEEESDIVVINEYDDKPSNYSFMLRPSLDYAINNDLNDYLRKFIIAPVVKAIDSNEPLAYLTEMRQVVILFTNIVVQFYTIQNLVDICNETYEIICDLAVNSGGCVNKLSMFDKDLMFLVIFGLRGFKHEKESRKALFCANQIHTKMKTLAGIDSVSIGVCTGITYCGVVGHQMRKEYTVIGRTVNKAARLMIAYPNMVTCDRQTFLQSFLQARFFILQPSKYLKGFKDVGPIYKFSAKVSTADLLRIEMALTEKYPILGRIKEMETIVSFLISHNFRTSYWNLGTLSPSEKGHFNMLILMARDRKGKSRVFHEIRYYITTNIESCKFLSNDYPKKFKLFRSMFGSHIKILGEKNIEIRTEKVKKFLHPFKVPEFLCGLNDILKVNFPVTKYYLRLTKEQKHFVWEKMIKYLCVKAFKRKKYLVTIDNIETMDEDSWSLLPVLLDLKFVIIVATISEDHIGPEAKKIFKRNDVTIINMTPVHKLYHAGLICQFMDCMGVSIELERFIQIRSDGNPGWIESILTTLQHSEVIEIVNMHKTEAHEKGIVIPHCDMLLRYPDQTITSSSAHLLEEKDNAFIKSFSYDIEDWEIFHQSIKENDNRYKKIPKNISVCLVPSGVCLENIDTEDIVDVKTILVYDDLKVHEQLLLKCCSVLGDSFSRKMLDYVLQSHGTRKNSEAIQKLFEIQVFLCRRASYNNGAIQINHDPIDPNDDKSINCYCTGFPIDDENIDLPKYANCGFIQFREPAFRQMLCNLLTDQQANLYHVRAMWFLESQLRRCLACGLGYFTTLIGQTNDDGMKKYSMEKLPTKKVKTSSLLTIIPYFDVPSFTTSIQRNRIGFNSVKDLKVLTPFVEKTINVGIISNVYMRTFIDNNLRHCRCQETLVSMYNPMVEHCFEAELHEKSMNALLEYATVCIKAQNISVAFTLLELASKLLDTKLKYQFQEPVWQVPLTRGRITYLKGLLHIERSAFDEAEKCLLDALKCYNISFPSSKLGINMYIWVNELKQKIIVEYFPHRHIGSKNEDVCSLSEQTSEVMSALFTLYMVKINGKLDYERAYLAGIWGMNEAFRSDSNFAVMCNAYANVIAIDLVYRREDIMSKIEDMAIKMCYRKLTRLEKHELEAVSKLYAAIFCRKYFCYNVLESLKLGKIVVQLNSPSFGGSNKWLMLPHIMRALVMSDLITQAALLIHEIKYYKYSNQTRFLPLIYFAICMEFRLCTTYSIEPFEEVKSLIQPNIPNYRQKDVLIIEMKYYVSIWLWFLRKKEWAAAKKLQAHVDLLFKWGYYNEISMIYAYMRLVEGLLILIVKKINFSEEKDAKQLKKNINFLFKELGKISNRLITVQSRCLLLKAYWYMILKKERKAFVLLDDARSSAKKCGVLYDIGWIKHTRNLWLQQIPPTRDQDKWQIATDTENLDIVWNNEDNTRMVIPFFNLYLPIK